MLVLVMRCFLSWMVLVSIINEKHLDDAEKTTLKISMGYFCYIVMPFDLKKIEAT